MKLEDVRPHNRYVLIEEITAEVEVAKSGIVLPDSVLERKKKEGSRKVVKAKGPDVSEHISVGDEIVADLRNYLPVPIGEKEYLFFLAESDILGIVPAKKSEE